MIPLYIFFSVQLNKDKLVTKNFGYAKLKIQEEYLVKSFQYWSISEQVSYNMKITEVIAAVSITFKAST